jgi:hypothetical protein
VTANDTFGYDHPRWISRDPLTDAEMIEGPNLYEYVWNDPIRWIDPLGLGPVPALNGKKCTMAQWNSAVSHTIAATAIAATAAVAAPAAGSAAADAAYLATAATYGTIMGGTMLANTALSNPEDTANLLTVATNLSGLADGISPDPNDLADMLSATAKAAYDKLTEPDEPGGGGNNPGGGGNKPGACGK